MRSNPMLEKLRAVESRYEELCAKSEQPDFYGDPKKAAKLLREKNDLEPVVEAYRAYMQAEQCTYEDDKRIWRQIYQFLLVGNSALQEALEEMEVVLDKSNWTTDMDVVLSYVIKTIKRFKEEDTDQAPLLQMFDTEEELQFANDLLDKTILGHEEYEQLINSHLKGWEADRIADMDRVILEIALAEIFEFPQIALTISLNEYIELAKEYSSEKSHQFINGILNEILRETKISNSLFKATTLR